MNLSIPAPAVVLQHNKDAAAHDGLERKSTIHLDEASTDVAVTLCNNSIYTYTCPLVSLSVTANEGLNYTGFNFSTCQAGTTFMAPEAWLFHGDECTYDNAFIPATNSRYRVAVESVAGTVVCDVQRYAAVDAGE